MIVLFWLCVFFVLYGYVGYPLLMFLASGLMKSSREAVAIAPPTVSVIISACNEEKHIAQRIQNLFDQNYPGEKMEVLIGSDGSHDHTAEILASIADPRLKKFLFTDQRGKAAVLNDLVAASTGEVLVFSDANTVYAQDVLRVLMTSFSDPNVGGVCGELTLRKSQENTGTNVEGSYWNFENSLKMWESDVRTALSFTGAIYSLRRELFSPLPLDRPITDDLLVALGVFKKGYRIVYEPRARAFEELSGSVAAEFKRKMRIGSSNFNGLRELFVLLRPKYGFVAFGLLSHKLLRWFTPFFLLVIFTVSILEISTSSEMRFFVFGEIALVLLAVLGYLSEIANVRSKVFTIPYYFVAVNLALLMGFLRFLFVKEKQTWEVIR